MKVRARFLFEKHDAWIGVFWKFSRPYTLEALRALRASGEAGPFDGGRLTIFACFVPFVPLRIEIGPGEPPNDPPWDCPRCDSANLPAWRDACDRCLFPRDAAR